MMGAQAWEIFSNQMVWPLKWTAHAVSYHSATRESNDAAVHA
jgi:hypothetical protein